MKKIIYIILLSVVSTFALSSCTEEVVEPSSITRTGGPAGSGSTGRL